MKSKFVSLVFVLFLAYGIVNSEPDESDEGGAHPEDYLKIEIKEGPTVPPTEESSSEGKREQIPAQDNRCRWSVHELHNEGSILTCECIKCVCTKGRWLCEYHFKQCPFFHCGQKIFSPITQKCCCGDIYALKNNWACCGYRYYDTSAQKCCPYSSLKNKQQTCPRSTI